MKISWHLLYEQLQNNPELLEEDACSVHLDKMPENEVQNSGTNINTKKETQAMLKLQARLGNAGFEKLVARQQTMASSTAKPSTKGESELESRLQIANKSDINERLNLLLKQFLNNFPIPALIVWKSLSDTFKQLPMNKQASVVSVLVNRFISLPTHQQAQFLTTMQNLPAGLAQSDLVAALNAQLLNRTTVAESPSIELPVIPPVVSSEGA